MRRIIIIVGVLVFFATNSYAFWIWSPKTKKWLNPEYSSYTGPNLQLKKGLSYFNSHKYKLALNEFRKLIQYYPDAFSAAQAQYYIGRCFEYLKRPYRAFQEYSKLIVSYPNSKKIQDAVKAEFNIGKYFLTVKPKRILGIPLMLTEDYPVVEIFKNIVKNSPYSKYAPKSLYNLGVFFIQNGRYDEAKSTFKKLIDSYPGSGLTNEAEYELATSTYKASLSSDYDQSDTSKARQSLKELLKNNNSSSSRKLSQLTVKLVRQKLNSVREKEAKKNFDTALFYEHQNKFKSALIYYRIVINNYSNTPFAKLAYDKIKALSEGKLKK